jgi:hypothetical protein
MKEGIKSGVCAFANGTMLCVTLLLLLRLAFLNGKVGIQRRRRGRRGRRGRPTSRIWIVRVGGGGGGREVQQISRDFDNPLNVRWCSRSNKKKITDMKEEGEEKERDTEMLLFLA